MRKKGSFPALVYRELVLCRKTLITYLCVTVIFSLIPILAILSIRHGNLALLPDYILADIRGHNDLILKLFAVISPCMLSLAVSEASAMDAQIKWDRFRRSTPVAPVQMALAKYTLYLIMLFLSVAAAISMMGLCSSLLGSPVTKTDIAVILSIIAVIEAMSVMAQVFIMLYRSVDTGMLAMLGCMAAMIFLIPREWRDKVSVEWLLSGAEFLLPLIPVIIAGTLMLGFGLTACIYRRREK